MTAARNTALANAVFIAGCTCPPGRRRQLSISSLRGRRYANSSIVWLNVSGDLYERVLLEVPPPRPVIHSSVTPLQRLVSFASQPAITATLPRGLSRYFPVA